MFFKKQKGNVGEALATSYLKKKGYTILENNYSCPYGEIDIIAQIDKKIVFVEVKTRSSLRFGLPQEAINPFKQRHIENSAIHYLKKHKLIEKVSIRFDCISILMNNELDYTIDHLEGIF